MGRNGERVIRRLFTTLAAASAMLACAPAAQAGTGITTDHHFSVSVESARLGDGRLVLTGVETHGLLHHAKRNSAARFAVRKFVAQWDRLGPAPYVAGTHEVSEAKYETVRPKPTGDPTYDPKRHRLSIPVDDRRSPRKLPKGRWVFANRKKKAPEQFVVMSHDFGKLQLTFSLPTVVAESWHTDDCTCGAPVQAIYTGTTGTVTLTYRGKPVRSEPVAPWFPMLFVVRSTSPKVGFNSSVTWTPTSDGTPMTLDGWANWLDPSGATGSFTGAFGSWTDPSAAPPAADPPATDPPAAGAQ